MKYINNHIDDEHWIFYNCKIHCEIFWFGRQVKNLYDPLDILMNVHIIGDQVNFIACVSDIYIEKMFKVKHIVTFLRYRYNLL